ncbi:hypothetical protein BDK51DRAFT_43881 [Blyttiomyces helicus]|uniref:Uncharacterized protein n=1 Tax=Blyttiomyces helicus TaxID=388810 RepID=A0A4P9WL32_9FUNG|nr:hypothetical protein BDK51DRAFT_43881 [Blyttiomyces helicus]|eukprot:RKO93731.1 hypothetical protein BDK51DRAFT_43881 [Blyttiomyces helicus]
MRAASNHFFPLLAILLPLTAARSTDAVLGLSFYEVAAGKALGPAIPQIGAPRGQLPVFQLPKQSNETSWVGSLIGYGNGCNATKPALPSPNMSVVALFNGQDTSTACNLTTAVAKTLASSHSIVAFIVSLASLDGPEASELALTVYAYPNRQIAGFLTDSGGQQLLNTFLSLLLNVTQFLDGNMHPLPPTASIGVEVTPVPPNANGQNNPNSPDGPYYYDPGPEFIGFGTTQGKITLALFFAAFIWIIPTAAVRVRNSSTPFTLQGKWQAFRIIEEESPESYTPPHASITEVASPRPPSPNDRRSKRTISGGRSKGLKISGGLLSKSDCVLLLCPEAAPSEVRTIHQAATQYPMPMASSFNAFQCHKETRLNNPSRPMRMKSGHIFHVRRRPLAHGDTYDVRVVPAGVQAIPGRSATLPTSRSTLQYNLPNRYSTFCWVICSCQGWSSCAEARRVPIGAFLPLEGYVQEYVTCAKSDGYPSLRPGDRIVVATLGRHISKAARLPSCLVSIPYLR